jgi:hypothetical protein
MTDGEEDVEQLVGLARGSLKGKKPELGRALTSRLTPAQRFVLNELPTRETYLAARYHRLIKRMGEEQGCGRRRA